MILPGGTEIPDDWRDVRSPEPVITLAEILSGKRKPGITDWGFTIPADWPRPVERRRRSLFERLDNGFENIFDTFDQGIQELIRLVIR